MKPFRLAPDLRFFLAASTACLCLLAPVQAQAFPIPEQPVDVVEFYNVDLHHYFLTAHVDEMAAIDAGSAGAGWTRTGWSFSAYRAGAPGLGTYCPAGGCGVPVSRFYSGFSNSHFYTADAGEAAGIQAPGSEWMLERVEFQVPVPDPEGHCASGVPVDRLYNNRFAFHDSNHRFVTDAGERAKMVAQGWIDEGVRFCALGASPVPIKSFAISAWAPTPVLPSAQCEDESIHRGPCVAINNLPTPSAVFPTVSGSGPAAFTALTGQTFATKLFVVPPVSADTSPGFAFVQQAGDTLGIHVDTTGRGPSMYSSVNPLYQMHTTVETGAFDDRFFPWAGRESEVQLAVSFTLNVKTIATRSAGSAAYGHPTVEFIDQRSGRHLYFTVATYGTPPALPGPPDYLAPDVSTGKVIVGTTFRADTPFGRSIGLSTLDTPSGFIAPNPWGWGGAFELRMDRAEFQKVLDAARTVDPALSAAPADYLVDNFHFNNEVFGDGEIGINLASYTLQLLRR